MRTFFIIILVLVALVQSDTNAKFERQISDLNDRIEKLTKDIASTKEPKVLETAINPPTTTEKPGQSAQ